MSAYPGRHQRRGAVARTAASPLPNLHFIVGLYFFGTGVLALALALSR